MPESPTRDQAREVAGTASDRGHEVADHAKGQAGEVADHAKGQARAVGEDARQHATAVVGEARQRARGVLDDAAGQARSQADEQAQRVSGLLRDAGRQLQAMASGEQASGPVVDLARSAGEWVDEQAGRLEQGGVRGTMDDLSRFARRRPGAFLLGAGVAGFLAGRVFRNADTQELKEAATGRPQGGQAGQVPPSGLYADAGAPPPLPQLESPTEGSLPGAGTTTTGVAGTAGGTSPTGATGTGAGMPLADEERA